MTMDGCLGFLGMDGGFCFGTGELWDDFLMSICILCELMLLRVGATCIVWYIFDRIRIISDMFLHPMPCMYILMYMFVLTIYPAVLAYLIMQRFTGCLPATQPPEMNSIVFFCAGLGLKPVRHHRGVLHVSTEWCVRGYGYFRKWWYP